MTDRPRTALVTGAAGQDGTYLCRLLLAEGMRVIGTVRPGSASRLIQGIERRDCDLSCPEAIEALLRETNPDEIYNLAAESFSPACWDRPAEATDLLGRSVLLMLEAIRRQCPQAGIFQASSSEMFGSPGRHPQDETTALCPETIYGAGKAFAHRCCGIYRSRYAMRISTGILFAHESPLRRPEFFTKKVARAAARIAAGLEREVVLGDLDARRDWTFAGDVACGMVMAMRMVPAGDYVFASGELHSIREFCSAAFARVGLDWRDHVRSDPALVRADPRTIVGDPRRANEVLGWRRTMSFLQLVEHMVDHERQALTT